MQIVIEEYLLKLIKIYQTYLPLSAPFRTIQYSVFPYSYINTILQK